MNANLLFYTGSYSAVSQVWQYITVTYDGSLGSSNIKIYVNGVQKGTDNETQNNLYDGWAWQIAAIKSSTYKILLFTIPCESNTVPIAIGYYYF